MTTDTQKAIADLFDAPLLRPTGAVVHFTAHPEQTVYAVAAALR